MPRCPSGIKTLLECPICRHHLIPMFAETSLYFHCNGGHALQLSDLLSAPSDLLKTGLRTLMADWVRQQEALRATAVEARKNGCLDVADIFTRHARSLGSRIELIQQAFSQSESSEMIRLPG